MILLILEVICFIEVLAIIVSTISFFEDGIVEYYDLSKKQKLLLVISNFVCVLNYISLFCFSNNVLLWLIMFAGYTYTVTYNINAYVYLYESMEDDDDLENLSKIIGA